MCSVDSTYIIIANAHHSLLNPRTPLVFDISREVHRAHPGKFSRTPHLILIKVPKDGPHPGSPPALLREVPGDDSGEVLRQKFCYSTPLEGVFSQEP